MSNLATNSPVPGAFGRQDGLASASAYSETRTGLAVKRMIGESDKPSCTDMGGR